MLKEFNDYLMDHTSLERRALVVDCLRTLESVLGAGIYDCLDPLLTTEESQESSTTLDTAYETILGLYYQAYSQFGIQLDRRQMEVDQFMLLNNGIESLLQIEVSEYCEELALAMECADDVVEALVNALDVVIPNSGTLLAPLVERVSRSLLDRIHETLADPAVVSGFTVEENEAYVKRLKSYNERFQRPELIEFLLDSGANLRLDPHSTLSLVAEHFVEYDLRQVAETIYALVVYSSAKDADVIPITKQLCTHAFADEALNAKLELLINDVFRS